MTESEIFNQRLKGARPPVDLLPEEAAAVMDEAEYRLVDRPRWYGPSTGIQIHYQGQWWNVARTDFQDDVCTFLVAEKTLAEWVEFYKERNSFGVRLRQNGIFAVIDSFSDG